MVQNKAHRDFFISFNGADLIYAEAIDAALRRAGFSTHFHPRDVAPGEHAANWMDAALLNSAQTLALYSPDYTKDAAVYSKAELYASLWQDPTGDKRKLIPIVLRETAFTPLIAPISRIIVVGMTPDEAADHVVVRLKSPEEAGAGDLWRRNRPLPRIFRAAYRSNPNFAGRLETMGALIKAFRAGADAPVVALVGMGGVGKTTLAAEYCHRFGGSYGGVWWVRAEHEPMMLADLQALSERLGVASNRDVEVDARAALDHIANSTEPWLVVYDDAPNPDAVHEWLPAGAARCIITSRFTEFGDITPLVRIDVWGDAVTAGYLLSRTGRDDLLGAARLAKQIGGLPLAAEQAAAYLGPRPGVSFDDYGNEITRLIQEPRPAGAKGQYSATVYATFVKSLEAAREISAGAAGLDFIRICAFLSPDGVDLALLEAKGGENILPSSFIAVLADKFRREDALAILTSLSLLRREDGPFGSVLIFHRLLLEVARDWIGDDGRALWGCAALRLVAGVFPAGDVHADPSSWLRCALLMPHIASLDAHVPPSEESRKALAHICGQASLYLCARGDSVGALVLAARSVAILRLIKSDPLVLAIALNNLGTRLQDVGRLKEAEKAIREALEIEEARLAPDNPSLSTTLSNLAGIYRDQKEFAKAEPLYLRVLEIRRAVNGEKSAEYGMALSNLGTFYGEWSAQPGRAARLMQAAELINGALIITQKARGERHPETATRHYNLVTLKWKTGDKAGAVAEAERALAIRLSLDLMMHRATHEALRDLMFYLQESGNHERAARILAGEVSELLPAIRKVEAEHLAWVAHDPNSRDFGPPSRFTAHR